MVPPKPTGEPSAVLVEFRAEPGYAFRKGDVVILEMDRSFDVAEARDLRERLGIISDAWGVKFIVLPVGVTVAGAHHISDRALDAVLERMHPPRNESENDG